MKARDLVVPSITLVVLVAIISQFSWSSKSAREKQRERRAEIAQQKTKEYLEKSARGEVDVLAEKYDLEILQNQLDKHKKKVSEQE